MTLNRGGKGCSRSLKIVPFDRSYDFYSLQSTGKGWRVVFIVRIVVCCIIFKLLCPRPVGGGAGDVDNRLSARVNAGTPSGILQLDVRS